MEWIKLGDRTYYIKNHTNIGVYQIDEEQVYLIDTGNDKEAGKKILKIVEEKGFKVAGIINTHSNADHIGGNQVIQNRTGCKILTSKVERCFTEVPILESSFLYGGYPMSDLRKKFLLAKPSCTTSIEGNLPEGLEIFSLKGHFFDMIGVKTSDNVYFLGDSLFSEETIMKYHVFFLYDVREYLNTLEYLRTLSGGIYVPSHCEATEDLSHLIDVNFSFIHEMLDKIYDICKSKITFEDLLKEIFDCYSLTMNMEQYVLVGSTIKSYLSYLYDEGKITYIFSNNKMYWVQK